MADTQLATHVIYGKAQGLTNEATLETASDMSGLYVTSKHRINTRIIPPRRHNYTHQGLPTGGALQVLMNMADGSCSTTSL